MNTENLIATILVFFQTHLFISIAVAVLIGVLLFLRPGPMLKILVTLLFLGVIFYFIAIFGGALSTGVDQKEDMIHKTEEIIE